MFSFIICSLVWLCDWFLFWSIENFKKFVSVIVTYEKFRLSVIFTTRNEERRIVRLMGSVMTQTFLSLSKKGYKQMPEGWSKGCGSVVVMIRPWIMGCFSAYVRQLRLLSAVIGIPWVFVYLASVIQIEWMSVRISIWQLLKIFLFPIHLVCFALLMLCSLLIIHVFRNEPCHGWKISTAWRGKS